MSLLPYRNHNNTNLDISETNKIDFSKGNFTHRSNNSYSLFNEIRLLKPNSKINLNNQTSFVKMNTKKESNEKSVNSPLISMEKKFRAKLIYSPEINLNDEQSKSELQNSYCNSKKVIKRNQPGSIVKENKKGDKELKLLYNSIDIRNDDLKKYWINQKKNYNSMNFIQIKPRGKEKKKQMNGGLKFNSNSLAPSTTNLFKKLNFSEKIDKNKDKDKDKKKKKEKDKGNNSNNNNNNNNKGVSNQRDSIKYTKVFKRVNNERNSVSNSKRKSMQKSLNSNIINLSLMEKEKNAIHYKDLNINNNKSQTKIKKLKTKSNVSNANGDNIQQDKPDITKEENIDNDNDADVNKIERNIDEPNDFISPDDEDEKRSPLCHLPIFASKKLSYYYSSNFQTTERKIVKCFSIDKIYKAVLQYLNTNDIISLSLLNTYFEKKLREQRYSLTISLVLPQYGMQFKNTTDSIWNHLRQYSKLSSIPYLKKTYLDNAFAHSLYLQEIKKDIIRTYPNDLSFNERSQIYKQLLYILNAYANYNPNIGYAQGLNFILSKILNRSQSEEEALLFLDAIVNRLHMETIVGISNQLETSMNYIGNIIAKALPAFDIFLKDNSLSHEVFTANWVITLFASTVDSNELYAIWDCVFIFGWKFVHCLIIAIIKTFQTDLMNLKFDNYSEEIRKIVYNNKFKLQFRTIILLAFDYMTKYESFEAGKNTTSP